jgi:hypothetical protein
MKTVSKRDEDGVEDEEGCIQRRIWMKTVACMLDEDGGMCTLLKRGEDEACWFEWNAQGQGLCSVV